MIMNYGNHNRNLGGRHGGFTADEWDRFQDNQSLHGSDWVAPGKTLRPPHYKMPLQNSTVDETIQMLLDALSGVMVNKADIYYKLGCAYRAKADAFNSRKYFELAAKQGHPDAMYAIGIKNPENVAPSVLNRDKGPSGVLSVRPDFKYFRVVEFRQKQGIKGWVLLVSLGDGRGLMSASSVIERYHIGYDMPDVYDNRHEAIDNGKRLKMIWTLRL